MLYLLLHNSKVLILAYIFEYPNQMSIFHVVNMVSQKSSSTSCEVKSIKMLNLHKYTRTDFIIFSL